MCVYTYTHIHMCTYANEVSARETDLILWWGSAYCEVRGVHVGRKRLICLHHLRLGIGAGTKVAMLTAQGWLYAG